MYLWHGTNCNTHFLGTEGSGSAVSNITRIYILYTFIAYVYIWDDSTATLDQYIFGMGSIRHCWKSIQLGCNAGCQKMAMSHWGTWFYFHHGILDVQYLHDHGNPSWEITPDLWYLAPHAENRAALLLSHGVKLLMPNIPIQCLHWKLKTLWTWWHDVVLLIAGHYNQHQSAQR